MVLHMGLWRAGPLTWLSTCAGVLGADAMEVKMEEQGEGQEEVEVLDEVS